MHLNELYIRLKYIALLRLRNVVLLNPTIYIYIYIQLQGFEAFSIFPSLYNSIYFVYLKMKFVNLA